MVMHIYAMNTYVMNTYVRILLFYSYIVWIDFKRQILTSKARNTPTLAHNSSSVVLSVARGIARAIALVCFALNADPLALQGLNETLENTYFNERVLYFYYRAKNEQRFYFFIRQNH